ncbi:ribonuclease Z [Bhargavaea ginsengi]|uniref:Ribonuclease Z n=1 Tax=Bhargavaea ginsengi TaxID=426757 RepID=A0A1H6WNW3_9BACL|nr:ribonuclease Z [Bhargavaea ginsengi]SEJ18563.1 ribonuclease Z [Bhargavaea ginsengi]
MQIQFLGTGAGMPSKQRNTSALALKLLEERGSFWLFDCGEAAQHRMLHTTLKPRKLDKIFITHLHGDHIFGLPGMLGSRGFLGGSGRLDLYGPKGLQEWIEVTLRISRTHLNYELAVHEVEAGTVFEDDSFTVRALPLDHVMPCFGYRIEQKPLPGKLLVDRAIEAGVPKGPLLRELKEGRDIALEDGTVVRSLEVTGPPQPGFTVAVLGDTRFTDNAVELSWDADIVIHEATFDKESAHLAGPYGHSTIMDAAKTAREAGARSLIANHISARFLPEDAGHLAAEAEEIFPQVAIAEDLAEYEWKNGMLRRINP